MKHLRRTVLITALAASGLAAGAQAGAQAASQTSKPEAYSLDPVHTRVLFAIEHAGFSQALGTVSGSTGSLLLDPGDWRSARLDVRVPLTRLDLGDARWNAAALAANLLDGERHPEAHFVSTRVEPIVDAGTDQAGTDPAGTDPVRNADAHVCGELTLRGVTRPLCLQVTLNALKRYPLPPFRRTAGFSATTTLSRADFGIDAWSSLIGDEVQLRIEAEAVRDNDAARVFGSGQPAVGVVHLRDRDAAVDASSQGDASDDADPASSADEIAPAAIDPAPADPVPAPVP